MAPFGAAISHAEEGLIEQNRHAPGRAPAAATSPGRGFRRLSRRVVILAALGLIALTWLGAHDAIVANRAESEARAKAELLGKAEAFEEQLRRELLSIE